MTELQQLKKRIDELEREVMFLKARPVQQVIEYHFHQQPPSYVPYPYPLYPPYWGQPTWGGGVGCITGTSTQITSGGDGIFVDMSGKQFQTTPTIY